MVRQLGTSPTISSQHLTSLLGFVCVLQTDTSSSYFAVDSTHAAVGHYWSLVRRSGTRCLTSSKIRCVVLTVLNSFLRQSCLVFTNVTSALEVFLNDMHYINPHFTYFTYQLTYVHYHQVINLRWHTMLKQPVHTRNFTSHVPLSSARARAHSSCCYY